MINVEEVVQKELQQLRACPKYENCVTGRAMSPTKCGDNCSIYGCSLSEEHSARYRIFTQLHVNGNLKDRRNVTGVIMNQVADQRIHYNE